MTPPRIALRRRITRETQVRLTLNLDGKGRGQVRTTLPFLDHMLDLFAKHGTFDLKVQARGDTHIDDHHLVEDIGLTLGEALAQALSDKKGLVRYGQSVPLAGRALTPMDETLSYIALDLSGRPYLAYRVKFKPQWKAPFDFTLVEDFFQAVAFSAKMNLHIKLLEGRNNHHIAESLFKGFGRALSEAVALHPRRSGTLPSTKGLL